ncbi:MAG: DEAD/DEAH box helicase [Polyangiaceae bacterium]|nr:DEAD/DEAH box helicase [Polyangiaceae bacterium]
MKIALTDGNTIVRSLPLSERSTARLKGISEPARLSLTSERGWRIPWRLALQAVSLAEATDEVAARIHAERPAPYTEEDLEILGSALLPLLPRATDLQLQLRHRGVIAGQDAAIVTEWRTRAGEILSQEPSFTLGFWESRLGPVRIHFGQLRALETIPDKSDLLTDRSTAQIALARYVGGLYPEQGVVLQGTLLKENIRVLDDIEPYLAPVADGHYQLRPRAADVPADTLEDFYYSGAKRPLSYKSPDGRHTRVVLSPRAERGLGRLRSIDRLSAAEAAHAASQPNEVFGPDLDLSRLSERVIGLGPPVRRVHASLREVPQQNWYDWDVVLSMDEIREADQADQEPTVEIPSTSLKDPTTRASFSEAIARADERGDALIPDPTGAPGFVEINEDLRQALRSAEALEESANETGGRLKKPPRQVLIVHENLERVTFEQGDAASTAGLDLPTAPPGLAAEIKLKPHQVDGFKWLVSTFGANAARGRGVMLADDMGLGKTLQVLSLLRWLQEEGRTGPHLVVAPLALLDNWQDEAARFFGDAFEPMHTATSASLPSADEAAVRRLRHQRLVLVSYDTLRRKELLFAQVPWDIVVLDEAQRAKELTSQIFRVVRTLNARGRIAMSGTPVENKLSELWALFDWAVPGLLDDARTFQTKYTRRLKAEPSAAENLAEDLLSRIRPFYRRRMKSEVATDLPPKSIKRQNVPLDPDQVEAYGRIARSQAAPLQRLSRLFNLCAHPDMEDSRSILAPVAERTFSKVEALFALLDDIHRRREKVLLFANRRLVQRWLADELEHRYSTVVEIINGEVADSRQRLDSIKRFSNIPGFAALVLAPRAAGVGLNITAANHVVHYTREWNPAIENQATDRAYRIGQTREVFVHHLVSTAPPNYTVEEKLHDLLEEKRRLMTTFVVPIANLEISVKELADRLA